MGLILYQILNLSKMKTKINIKLTLGVILSATFLSCSKPSNDLPENEGQNILTFESIELTSYDYSDSDNNYDEFGVVVEQNGVTLHSMIDLNCWNNSDSFSDLPLELLCESPEITDFDNSISVAFFGYNSSTDDLNALGGFSVDPNNLFDADAENDKVVNYNSTSSIVPFSLKLTCSSAINYAP
jgi:hypothetical protein